MSPSDQSDREAYGAQVVDPENQLQPEDTLLDRGVEDALDEGWSPPEREPAHLRQGMTREEQRIGASLDERLAAEEPEPDPYSWIDAGEPDPRAGRLVSPDQGGGEDTEKDEVGVDVGIDGAGASAEEAAVHVIDPEADPDLYPETGPAGPETEPLLSDGSPATRSTD
jgi:hypothetical protein